METNVKAPYSRWRTPQGRIYEVMYSNEKFTRMQFEDTGKCRTEYSFKTRFDEEVRDE
ncbi:hypothetical protein [Marinococcus halophilus]|uniref:hypothetical protein n=1 Tax=Marinococcus halophilus TaxID=1371 RepID=UPI0015C45BCE|nr:hypothetical protein [Marinococcus halophilus]